MKDLLRWMLMILSHAAQDFVPYIQPESNQSCYAALRFKCCLTPVRQASVAGAARPVRACGQDCMKATPWIEGEVPPEVVAVQPRDRGDGSLTS
jgi:hypothetical protein